MIYIGSHIFDIEKRQLLLNQGESIVHLEPKLFDLLLLFTEQPNRILTRDDLLAHLWPGTLVTDNAVNKLIGNLRKILGDDAKSPALFKLSLSRAIGLFVPCLRWKKKQLSPP